MDINIKTEFPDAELLEPGEWSEYGKTYVYGQGHFIEIGLYRETLDDSEYAGHLTLHVFDGDTVIGCYDVERLE